MEAEIRRFQGHTDLVASVAFSPNGRFALSGSWDQTVRLWDVKTGRQIRCFQRHTDSVTNVAFSPDCHLALSGSCDKTVRLWDVKTGHQICRFKGHTSEVRSVVFSPDGRFALSGSRDKTVRLITAKDEVLSSHTQTPSTPSKEEKIMLDDLIVDWLSEIQQKHQDVIYRRYGLLTGDRETLGEVGRGCLGISRERARQIQRGALKRLRSSQKRYTVDHLIQMIVQAMKEAGGLMTEEQVGEFIASCYEVEEINPTGAALLILDVHEEFSRVRRKPVSIWGLSHLPFDFMLKVQKVFTKLLSDAFAPLSCDKLLSLFEQTDLYMKLLGQSLEGITIDDFLLSCIRTCPQIIIDAQGQCALEKWKSSHIDEVVVALREIGEPAHYKEIARRVNELLPPELRTSAHNIHRTLGRRRDLFVRVGHGIFGLVEWGLPDDGNVANAVYRILNEAPGSLSVEVITQQVLKTWKVNPGTVYAAIQNDSRFVQIGHGVYWLRDRLTSGGDQADFETLFSERLSRLQAEQDQPDTDEALDAFQEVEKIRRLGTDFLK